MAMLNGKTIICVSTIEWEFSWQPNQEIMHRLATAGNSVLFIETTGARNVKITDWKRILKRLQFALGSRLQSHRTHPNLDIYSPLVLPFPHSRLAHALNTYVIFRAVDAWLHKIGRRDLLLWAFLASPMTLALIEHTCPSLVVYQCMGDVTASRPIPEIARAERELMSRCDLAFANSLRLLEHLRQFTSHAYLFRAGVDVNAFERKASQSETVPVEFAGLTGPIAGYVGSIHQWMDLELLAEVAQKLPTWQFVMIGPVLRDVSRLRGLANIHWLGQRPHHELPRYIRHFDVGIIPYILDNYTASAYPGKLNEYLALGKPVVTTQLPELQDFNDEFNHAILLAADAPSFADALRRGLTDVTDTMREGYRKVARLNSWDARVEGMSHLIEDELLARRAQA
jgi:glycosyltransferase involved in cell wall biosynthesis